VKQSRFIVSGAILAVMACTLTNAWAGVDATISAPGASNETPVLGTGNYTGYDIETFDTVKTGVSTTLTKASNGHAYTSPVGTFIPVAGNTYASYVASPTSTGPGYDIEQANEYSGAGDTGNYMSVGSETDTGGNYTDSVLINLNGEESYFGVWAGAIDGGNVITLLNNGVTVFTMNANTLDDAIAALPNASSYLGNPSDVVNNVPADNDQYFAYLNFFGTSGTTFNEVLLTETENTSAGFEFDNPATATTFTSMGGTAFDTPEPGTTASLCIGAMVLGGLILSRRRTVARLS